MKRHLQTYILLVVASVMMMAGCTSGNGTKHEPQPTDTTYTEQAAMDVYDYNPVRALRIVDSAVIVGNLSEVRADLLRSRIFSWSIMGQTIDSLLHGPEGVRYDSARVIGERLLTHDSIRANLSMQQDVLEMLVGAARQHKDTLLWLQRAQQLVEVCHRQGDDAEPEALRTEAEVGAALCRMGQREQGMARLDSMLAIFESQEHRQFNWLDAYVVTSKRKLKAMSDAGRDLEALPLALRVIERLADYEQHPEDYHDGTYREPKDDTERDDYIRFYRSQIQAFITAVHASLGHQGSMEDTYQQIERSILDATAREHMARYRALEQKMLRREAESRSRMMTFVAIASVSGLLVILLFAAYLYFQKRRIQQKNHVLAKLIEERNRPSSDSSNNKQLFTDLDSAIRSERLYANPTFQRQDACDHFNIRREVLNQLLSDYANGLSFPAYINSIRLSEACRLLSEHPAKTVNAIAEEVGLTPRNLRRLFVDQYGMTPSEYRNGLH